MPVNRTIQNFNELRTVLDTLLESTQAALDFMDANGIGLGSRTKTRANANGNGHGVAAKLERVKRHYTQRRPDAAVPAPPSVAAPYKPSAAEQKYQQRLASWAFLSKFDTVEARQTGKNPALGALARRGYLKRKGDGYIRTAKVYEVGPAPKTSTPHQVGMDAPTAENDPIGRFTPTVTMKEAAAILKMSEANVRLLANAGKVKAHKELRARQGMFKQVPTLVLPRAEVERYATEQGAL